MLHPIPSLMNINKMDLGESYDYYMEGITPILPISSPPAIRSG